MLSHSVVSDSFATPWTVAHQAPLSMGFSRQEYWSRLPCPSPGNLLNPGIESVSFESPHWQADCLWLGHLGSLWSSQIKKKERKKKRKRDRRRLLSCRVRGIRDQIANICWITEKAREFQKNIYFCFTDYDKTFVWITTNCGKFFKRWEYQTTWPVFWETCCRSRSNG